MTVGGFWIDDRIRRPLWYGAWLHFTIHYYTHSSVHSHVFTRRCPVAASNGERSPCSGFPTASFHILSNTLFTNRHTIQPYRAIYLFIYGLFRVARGSVVGWGTMPQAGRSRVRFPMSLDFLNLLNLPAALWPLGSTQPLTEMSTRNLPGGKGRQGTRNLPGV
jgi:hypothetical protein